MQRKFHQGTMKYVLPVLVASLLLLQGCAPVTSEQGDSSSIAVQNDASIQQANDLLKQNKKREAAQAYYNAAAGYPSPQKERVILQAAEIAASIGDDTLTSSYLGRLNSAKLDGENQGRFAYVKALLALQSNNADLALQNLPEDISGLSPALREKVTHVRQRALALGGKSGITASKVKVQNALVPASTNYIAVLLPQSGALGSVSQDIYQGIQSARSMLARETTVKLYDVGNGGAVKQYQQAIADGADMIVGPLDKDSLAELLAQPQVLSKPLLSLNYLTNNRSIPAALYQFGLLPEDEARQVAEFAAAHGQRTAIVLAPNSAWGERVANAFRSTYQRNGGQVVALQQYADNPSKSYQQTVETALASSQGQASMVFLAASPSQARLIRPILADAAPNLPVYATSHIFSGRTDPAKDRSLDGIVYTEIPWVLQNVQSSSLNSSKYPRMVALGMDAFMIAKNLPEIARQPNAKLDGKTGQISLASTRQVQRNLSFATFNNGLPQPLGQ